MVHKCWCNFFLSFSALYFEDAYHPPHQYDNPRWWSSGVSLRDVSGLHFEDPVADSGPGTNCGADFVSSSWSSWSWWWGWQYDERSNLPCLQITPKRSQRNLFLTTVLLGAEVGSIDIVGDNSRLVVGPGAGQGPTGRRDRGRAQQGTHANPRCSKSSSSSPLPIFACYGMDSFRAENIGFVKKTSLK